MIDNLKFTFGPIPSRRFGMSLGIDLSPSVKQCNFDCLYCELAPAKTIIKQNVYVKVEDVLEDVKKSLKLHKNIDVITVTANGEPTLYPYLDELIDELNIIKENKKTLILSNGGNIYQTNIQKTLLKFDIVKLSLDCVSETCFRKLDRINANIQYDKIVDAMVDFKEKFKNELVLETLFVKNLNDSNREINLLFNAYKKISPSIIHLGTIHRPPAYNVKALSFDEINTIANVFKDLPIVVTHKNTKKSLQNFTKNEIKSLLRLRPLNLEDIENTFDTYSKDILKDLVSKKIVRKVLISGIYFFKI